MKILILGADGYYGYSLFSRLKNNHRVKGIDNFSRRNITESPSLIPLPNREEIAYCDITNARRLDAVIKDFCPDVVIHLAEQRSAPYSMKDRESRELTLHNNFISTVNVLECAKKYKFKIIHIGSMGMYGYENDYFIREGSHSRKPGSIYHLSKVIDESLFESYNRLYGIEIAELAQGTIWGIGGRFDYDALYGTVINRFIVQNLLGIPLTVYGKGDQTRSFIHIDNSLDSVELVLNTGISGYEIYNQFTQVITVNNIAAIIGGEVQNLPNPRIEKDSNQFETENIKLMNLGLKPKFINRGEIQKIEETIEPYLQNVNKDVIYPIGVWQ